MDSDGDGLSDVSEGSLGTDRNDSDSDDDGLSDGDEVNVYGTDPTNADSDDDGLRDAEEISNGTDPNDATSFPSTTSAAGDTGPYFDNVSRATSEDGVTWTVDEDPLLEHASVPDLIYLNSTVGDFAAGTAISYFVDASDFSVGEQIGMIYSTDDGETWSEQEVITIVGSEGQTPVDPSIVQLENGSLRLYYFDLSTVRSRSGEYSIYAASSEDGKTFTVEQVVFKNATLITDPEVIFFNEIWIMYMPMHDADGNIIIATSTDGLDFEYVENTDKAGVPRGAVVVENEVYLYGCDDGITLATSSDGFTFGAETVVIEGEYCDAGPARLSDGSFLMMTKNE
jgi:hypothetical protein